ncbi:hypothetical protein tpqmel_0214 [Candidatus Gastranaerophilus sp. (ex Termes propinquus)]|nr:hypothetical protein tpqmel_0214 [Candidatus Gastranaerophilus sp. (ex Termes propinquus)]
METWSTHGFSMYDAMETMVYFEILSCKLCKYGLFKPLGICFVIVIFAIKSLDNRFLEAIIVEYSIMTGV